jgi:anti-sigma factor RsiW
MKPEEARELLPWYAAGALEPNEARAVEAVLRQSPQLDQELAEWRALRSTVAEVGDDEPAFRPELIEDAHRRIDAYEQAQSEMRRGRRASRRASSGAIHRALAAAGAQIVAGPSGQDAYLIDLGDVDDAELAQTLERLRANTAVVRFATPAE